MKRSNDISWQDVDCPSVSKKKKHITRLQRIIYEKKGKRGKRGKREQKKSAFFFICFFF